MPKKPYPIERYDGGMDNNTNPSDIADNEFELLENVDVSVRGNIKMLGGKISSSISDNAISGDLYSGYGLFSFKSDRTLLGAETGQEFLVAVDSASGEVDLYDSSWNSAEIDFGSAVTGIDFSVADGVLRACPINLAHTARMLTYIDNYKFGSVAGYADNDWIDRQTLLSNGDFYKCNLIDSVGSSPASIGDITLNVEQGNISPDSYPDAKYEFRITTIYIGGQESHLDTPSFYLEDNADLSPLEYLTMADGFAHDIRLQVKATASGDIDEAILGYKVYIKYIDNEDWQYLAYFDIERGGILPSSTDYNAWTESGGIFTSIIEDVPFTGISPTYLNETGYGSQYSSAINLSAKWKTSVLAGRSLYIGNVKRIDETGSSKSYPDAMFRSGVGKFDTFELSGKVEVTINDGEDIVKLEYFGDRILQFKEKTLYIVNVSQSIEFLEERKKNLGITKPYHSFETEYGIVWINKNGFYFYDGRSVKNLFEKDGRLRISKAYWNTFFSDNSSIGYDPESKKVIISQSNNGFTNDILVYNFTTNSIASGVNKLVSSKMSNFIVHENKLTFAHSVSNEGSYSLKIDEWQDEGLASSINIITKAYNMLNSSIRKKIYKAYITHKLAGAASLKLAYKVNDAVSYTDVTDGKFDSTTPFTLQDFKLDGINNVYKIQFKIYTYGVTTLSTFEINDINIIYRNKTVK